MRNLRNAGVADAQESRSRDHRPRSQRLELLTAGVVLVAAVVVGARAFSSGSGSTSATTRPDQPTAAVGGGGPAVTAPPVGDAPGRVLVDMAGAGVGRSEQVSPQANWALSWAYDCFLVPNAASRFTLTVVGIDGTPSVARSEVRASGVERYAQGGPTHVEIASGCSWTVKLYG